jgi:hypothetical protein
MQGPLYQQIAEELRKRMADIPTLVDVHLQQELDAPELLQLKEGHAPTADYMARASWTSMPRYRTVLSILLCSNRSFTARRLPVGR